MNDATLRRNLLELLEGGSAHLTLEQALAGLSPELRAKRPTKELKSVYEILEHMRRAQEDILRYTLDPGWQSPPWPAGYWPEPPESLSEEAWQATLKGFRRELEEVTALVQDENRDLTAELPHGQGRTYLRQVLLIADHNAYHLGQIVDTRRLLGAWAD